MAWACAVWGISRVGVFGVFNPHDGHVTWWSLLMVVHLCWQCSQVTVCLGLSLRRMDYMWWWWLIKGKVVVV